jgi:hypothetical protein
MENVGKIVENNNNNKVIPASANTEFVSVAIPDKKTNQ